MITGGDTTDMVCHE